MSSLKPISAGVTRYLRRYPQISADICRYHEGSVYNTILSARGTIQLPCLRLRPAHRSRAPRGPIAIIAFVAFVATASLLATAAITLSSDTVVVSAPLPPRGVDIIFGGVRRGVVIVVVILVRAPNFVKETPGVVVVVRMGKDDRPSPTTTHHVLPLWRH